MKAYHKRLLTIALTLVLLMCVSSVFISGVFSVDARQLQIAPTGSALSTEKLNRSTGMVPTAAEINADGYDTVLASGFEQVLADDKAILYFKKKTAEVALQDLATGQIWYSNPQDRDQESQVSGTTKLRLGAQVTVTYYDQKGAFGQMDSYNDSIEYDGMTWEVKDDELLVSYYIGKTVVTLGDVPQQISKSRMEQFISVLPEEDQEDLLKNYKLASIEGRDEAYIENLVKKYPNVINEDVYYLTKDSNRILKKIKGYMDQCGYTYDDLDYDNAVNQVEVEESSRAHFSVTLSYKLDNGALVAAIKGDSLAYDEKIPPYEIRFLEYFGAGGKEEQGYMLVPDGSGSLIYYNNGKTNETVFALKMYGADTVSSTDSAYVADKKASLPIFGVKNGQAALLVSIEQGAPLCTINARVAGMQNSYNTVYATVMTTAVDFMQISDSRQIYFEETPFREDVVLRYQPMAEADNDYMGMARSYRQRLLDSGVLTEQQDGVYPIALDLIGAVPSTAVVAGIPVKAMEAVTTYAQAADIVQSLSDLTAHMWLRLEGWQKGGMRQPMQTKIQPEQVLGGAEGWKTLVAKAEANGWLLLPEVYLATDLDGTGLTVKWSSIRDLCRDVAVRYDYDYISRYRRYNGHAIYQLTAERFLYQAEAFGADVQKNGLVSAAVADLGVDLWSDFTKDKSMNRVAMAEAQTDALTGLAQHVTLALRNPNGYALEATDAIYDMPCTDSGFRIADEAVPFYQAVVRGSIPYVSEPINYQDDCRMAFLQAVEFGAGLQYTLTWETTALLKDTDYAWINRGRYSDWEQTIREQASSAAAALTPLAGVAMTGHERVSFNVYRTTYADGSCVVVNYGSEPAAVDGVTVPAMDFVLMKAGEL